MTRETAVHTMTLEELKPGESGIICQVGSGRGAVKRRLVDMGLTPGTAVYLRKIAPFGDPIEITLRGYELSLRREDAGRILVCPPEDAPAPPRRARKGMVQHIPDEAALRRKSPASGREGCGAGTPRLALAGNPNCGKTTLFNALTGSSQYVGNWPGVTVEKKEGSAQVDGQPVTLVDLPGIYSLSPYSMEEIAARDFVVGECPDAIINLVDASNLERNLYLTVQLLELERPMVVALNFMDEVEKRGDKLEIDRISQALGVPVIPITARTGENVSNLLQAACSQIGGGQTVEPDELYDDFTRRLHHELGELIRGRACAAGIPVHWAAVKLLEGDRLVERALNLDGEDAWRVEAIARQYEDSCALGDRETLVADARYRFVQKIVQESVRRGQPCGTRTLSDRIDAVATHRWLAVPVFLLMMLALFSIVFGPGQALSDGVDVLINGVFAGFMRGVLTAAGVVPWVERLLVDGVISGVGGVLVFLPQIALLFLFLSLLEDSGYMARAAFIMDRLLRRFGLSGKAFIPMLMGFGCTVPAIMGARTMESEKDRRMTIMLTPFLSCSARLPVYGLISAAFFPKHAGLVVFSLYMLGLLCAAASGLILKRTLFRGEPAAFVLELPPYRLPTLRGCLRRVWERVQGFLVKAGTLILAMSIALWFLQSFGLRGGLHLAENPGESILGTIGTAIAPVFAPLGFGTWQAAVALLTGLIAKEAVVSSLALLHGFSSMDTGTAVAAALGSTFPSPAAAYAFLVFVLLYVPCAAAVSAMVREMNSLKWTLCSAAWQIGWAWGVSFLIYQAGRLLL